MLPRRWTALFLAGCCLPALLSSAQENPAEAAPVLRVFPERTNAVYRPAEPIRFVIELQQGPAPVPEAEVQWTLTQDGLPLNQSGKATVRAGRAVVTGALPAPGFLQCRVVWNAGSKPLSALGAAGVAPEKIPASLPPPADFGAFWSAQKELLARVPANPRLTPVKSPVTGVECFDLQADSVGAPVSGYFARPAGARPRSLPILLSVHGAGVRSASLEGAAGWARQQFLALDLNAHGLPNGRPGAFYEALAAGELRDYRLRGRESRDTVYFRGMFLRLVRALDVLAAQPEWDGRTVVVSGSSQGGAQAIAAAGLDERVTFFAAGVPAMCDHTGVLAGRVNGWPKFVPTGADGRPDARVVEAVRYYDAMNFAGRTRAGAVFTVGFIDTTCPPTSVYAAYNQHPGPKEIFHDLRAGHTNTPEAVAFMRRAILEHVAARRLPAP